MPIVPVVCFPSHTGAERDENTVVSLGEEEEVELVFCKEGRHSCQT